MSIIGKIGAAIRAFLRKHKWIKVAGRWVMMAIPGGGAEEVAMPAEPAPVSAPDADVTALKAAAASLAADMDPNPEHLAALSERQMQWLIAMDQRMLCRVACAESDQIRAHLRGQATIKGVLRADKEAVDAFVAAKAGIIATEGKTVAQELAERGIVL